MRLARRLRTWLLTTLLAALAAPASAIPVEYELDFAGSGTATGGSGILTVDLPGTPGSDVCASSPGCDSPPAFSVLIAFVGTVNGVDLDASDTLRVGINQTIAWSANDLSQLQFNLFDAEGDGIRLFATSLTNGMGGGSYDVLDDFFVINGSQSTFTIQRVPEPSSVLLALVGTVALLTRRRRIPTAFGLAFASAALWVAPSANAQVTLDYSTRVSARTTVDFPMMPTEDGSRDTLVGSNFVFLDEGGPVPFTGVDFHEIFNGRGPLVGSPTSDWEIDIEASASLASGSLRVEALARDLLNAEAVNFPLFVGALYTETLEFSGPTNPDGNYEITFTTRLDPFTAQDEQLTVFPTERWRAQAFTDLEVVPADTSFSDLDLRTIGGELFETCPTFDNPSDPFCAPPFYVTGFEESGTVVIPGSNPVLTLTHLLFTEVTTASIDASNTATLEIGLAPGVEFVSSSGVFLTQVPEPSAALLAIVGALVLAAERRRRR